MSQVRAGAAYVELLTRDSAFVKGLQSAQKRLNSFASSTKLLGTKLMGLGVAAATPIAGSVAVYSNFDDAMRAVKGVTQATADEFVKLRDKAKQLGATTSYSASEVASLMTELGRAGFKPDQLIEMTGAVMNMARATGTDATQASGIMAATIRQFGLEATDATRVADGFTTAANKTFNSVEALGEAFQYAGPVAADANMSLEETLAILGTLGNVGIQGSEAGTALRRLLTLSAAESEKFRTVFGVVTKDAKGNARSLVDVLGEVAAATANMGSADRASKFNEVFGLLGITSASAIGKSVADTRELYAALQDMSGVSAKTAAEMDSGIGGALRILKSSIEAVAIAIGESLDGSVTSMVQAFSRAASGLVEWIGKNQRIVKIAAASAVAIIGIGAALFTLGSFAAAAAFAVGGLASIFSFIGASIGVIVSAVGMLFTPLGLVVAAIAALGAYFLYSTGIAGQATEYLKGVFQTLKTETIAAFGAIANALAAGDITAATDVLWTFLKLQWIKGTTFIQGVWTDFTQYIADVWADSAYAIGDVLISALSGLAGIWNSTLGFMADGWTILTSTVMKGWNTTIGFLKKGFLRLHELVDIAGDVSVQIGGILINALAGVETAWVETVDYLADTWSVFVSQVKLMWNSTVGFLKKAWIKLKALFDDDINVDVEMAKIDADNRAAEVAEDQKKQQAVADRMQRRDKRKAEIEASRVEMQKGIKQQLDARRKAREGQDIDADMRAIDDDVAAKNAAVDASDAGRFAANDDAQASRQQTIDDTTDSVRSTLNQMRSESKAARDAARPGPEDRQQRDQKINDAQAEFDAAVEHANNVNAPSDTPIDATETPPVPMVPPAVPKPGEVDIPKVDLPAIDDPKLKPPKKKDLTLGLDRDAEDSLDKFTSGPEQPNEQTEVSGNFDATGLGLGSGASTIPVLKLEAMPEPPVEVVDAPLLNIALDEVALDDQPNLAEAADVVEPPAFDIVAINAAFASVSQSLAEFDAALTNSTSHLTMPSSVGDSFSEDMKRAIVATAENTRRLVERSQSGGLVFS